MKAFATLAAVLTAAAAAIPTAGALEKAEKTGLQPGVTVITSAMRPVSGSGGLEAAKPSLPATTAVDPRAHVTGPADVDDGAAFQYELSVSNDGDTDLPGPVIVDLEAAPAIDSASVTGNGWTCSLAAHTCEWPSAVPAGGTTSAALFDIVAAPPYGGAGDCDRSPCLFLSATVSGYPASTGAAFTAVTVNGQTPPLANDDLVYMPTPPAPIEINAVENDIGLTQLQLQILTNPTDGVVTVGGDMVVTYTPSPSFSGSDSFRYQVTDFYGGTDVGVVHIGTLTGGIAFRDALTDIGQVEVGRIAMRVSWIDNTTGVDLVGNVAISALDPAEIPGVLAGTGYDPSQAVYDPTVFLPRDGWGATVEVTNASLFGTVKPKAPLGTVWLARLRLTVHPLGSPTVLLTSETVLVARSATAAEAPVHARDDVQTVPPDAAIVLHPLVNDDALAGDLSVTGLAITNWFEDDGEPYTAGILEFAEGTNGHPPFLGVHFTPEPGFLGTTRFYYALSAIVNGSWLRYDWARFELHVGALPPPPVAVASGSATLCAGASTGLSGSGGVTCSWAPATGLNDPSSCTPTASPASTTTYTLTVRDQYNQPSTNNPTVTVTVNARPIAVAGGSATITLGQSTPLSGSGGVSCSWSPGTGLNNPGSCAPMASPVVTTTYALAVTSAAGCVSTNPATATITVVQALADLVTGLVVPFQGRAGQPIPIVFATLNIGSGNAVASTTRFYLSRNAVLDPSDVSFGTFAVPALAAGQVRVDMLNAVIPANANGAYYVIASADDGHVVSETNETNNVGVSPWRIQIR